MSRDQAALFPIPASWAWATVADIGEVVSGGTPSTKNPSYWGEDFVWFSPADLTGFKGKYISRGAKSLTASGLANSSARLMPAGAVMFSSRAPIGYVAITTVEAATNQGFKSIVTWVGMDREYIYYYLNFARHLAEERATGTTFKEISGSAFGKLDLPVPPEKEQHQIVAKIEEVFSELNSAAESLTTAQEQLRAYRQSALKHAFDQPAGPTRLGEHIEFLTSGSRGWAEHYAHEGDIFIRAQNLKRDRLDLSDIAFVRLPPNSTEGTRTKVRKGDILITITGANVTKTGIVRTELGTAYVSQHVALCRPRLSLLPEYLYWFLLSEAGGRKQLNDAAYGAGKPGLNLGNIRDVAIPVPSTREQERIISLISAAANEEAKLEGAIVSECARIHALRQSILKAAFRGQLVPQDPKDEPAAALLERIRAERKATGSAAKNTGKRPKVKTV